MIGTVVGMFTGAYGKKPKIPELPKIDLTQNQKDTVAGNQAVLPAAQELGSDINDFNAAQMQKLQNTMFPQYDAMFSKAAGQAGDMMAGKLPKDVEDFVRRQSLSGSIGSGTFGSQFSKAGEARNLGLTSLDMVKEGLSNFSGLAQMSRALMPTPFDVTSMFMTPTQRYTMQNEQNNQQFQRQTKVNEIKAMGDPAMLALSTAMDDMESQVMSMAGGAMGMMCWVAREVYGPENPRWRVFRYWLTNIGPKWFLALYARFGEAFAAWIKDKPALKAMIRRWMDSRIERLVSHG